MAQKRPFITMLTDFGLQDTYAAIMKGVIYTLNPSAVVIDISHNIKPQDVQQAAFQLLSCYRYFPKGTIHVVVVDPGVGSARKMIVAKTSDYYFVAPDNGVLSYVLQKERSVVIREITNKKYFLQKLSNTFHGRDVFAPVAVHLCRDTACRVPTVYKQLGTVCKTPLLLPLCVPSKTKNTIKGTMIHIDHFGNIITNITAKEVRGWRSVITTIKNKEIHGLSSSYASVAKGKLLVIEGSTGFFEIARREGSAAHFLKVQKGTKIMMRRTDNV